MKKLILVVIFIMLLGGCTSNRIKNDGVRREGILTSAQMTTWMYGTHILLDDIGKPLTVLISGKINLDKYEGKKVEVQGNLKNGYPVDLGPEYIDVQNIRVIKN